MTSKDKTPVKRGALGKGISSLLGDVDKSEGAKSALNVKTEAVQPAIQKSEVMRIAVGLIDPNPHQPRRIFEQSALTELASSIKVDGLLQPIVVTASDSKAGRYTIIAGERRFRAAKLAGFSSISAIVKEGGNEDLLRLALIENIQREELNPIEEAEAYAALIKDFGLTQEQCAERVGKERATVANILRLLALPREIQDDIVDGRLTMGHGRCLLSLEDKKLMLRARDIVVKKNLNVRQAEQLCKTFGKSVNNQDNDPTQHKDADLNYVTEGLRSYLHTKVKLAGTQQRGRIEISFFSAAELERILKLIGYQI